jgi:hypothetical protein
VAWCAGIQDVLMTAGVLGAIVAASASATVLSLVAVAASLLSKETAVAAPFLMWLSNRTRWRTAAACTRRRRRIRGLAHRHQAGRGGLRRRSDVV